MLEMLQDLGVAAQEIAQASRAMSDSISRTLEKLTHEESQKPGEVVDVRIDATNIHKAVAEATERWQETGEQQTLKLADGDIDLEDQLVIGSGVVLQGGKDTRLVAKGYLPEHKDSLNGFVAIGATVYGQPKMAVMPCERIDRGVHIPRDHFPPGCEIKEGDRLVIFSKTTQGSSHPPYASGEGGPVTVKKVTDKTVELTQPIPQVIVAPISVYPIGHECRDVGIHDVTFVVDGDFKSHFALSVRRATNGKFSNLKHVNAGGIHVSALCDCKFEHVSMPLRTNGKNDDAVRDTGLFFGFCPSDNCCFYDFFIEGRQHPVDTSGSFTGNCRRVRILEPRFVKNARPPGSHAMGGFSICYAEITVAPVVGQKHEALIGLLARSQYTTFIGNNLNISGPSSWGIKAMGNNRILDNVISGATVAIAMSDIVSDVAASKGAVIDSNVVIGCWYGIGLKGTDGVYFTNNTAVDSPVYTDKATNLINVGTVMVKR